MTTVADKLAKKSSKTTTKQVRLRLVYLDFWSAVKLSFLAAVAIAIATVVFFVLIFLILESTGLISQADEFIGSVTGEAFSMSAILSLPVIKVAMTATPSSSSKNASARATLILGPFLRRLAFATTSFVRNLAVHNKF